MTAASMEQEQRVTATLRAIIASRVANGESVAALAKEYGMSETSIKDLCLGAALDRAWEHEAEIVARLEEDEEILRRTMLLTQNLEDAARYAELGETRRVQNAKTNIRLHLEALMVRCATLGAGTTEVVR